MKLLLTSAGISNKTIRNALINLLGKPIAESTALSVPTAMYALPNGGDIARRVITGSLGDSFCDRVGNRWDCWNSQRYPASNKKFGFPCSWRQMPCVWAVVTVNICVIG
jgi:hypothetical protein